jgi:hypothetical protein
LSADAYNPSSYFSCIPIGDDEFKPVGIVSWRDLLKSVGAV